MNEILRETVLASLRTPRVAARTVLGWPLGLPAIVEAAVAISALGIVIAYVMLRLAPDLQDPVASVLLTRPLVGLAIQLAVVFVMAGLTVQVGRLFGGQGDMRGALALVVWLNFVMVTIQIAQLVLVVLLPPLAAILTIAVMIWMVWALASFIAELHGFPNIGAVVGGMLVTLMAFLVAASLLASLLGVALQGG